MTNYAVNEVELAALLGCGRQTIRRYIERGIIKPNCLNKRETLYDLYEVAATLETYAQRHHLRVKAGILKRKLERGEADPAVFSDHMYHSSHLARYEPPGKLLNEMFRALLKRHSPASLDG